MKIIASIIKRASYATLTQLCIQLGVEFRNQPKPKLVELLLNKFEASPKEQQNVPVIKNGAEIKQTANNAKKIIHIKSKPIQKVNNAKKATTAKKETKSSKILAMYLKGSKVSEISEALSAHPSFCYTVISKHKAKK